MIHIISYKAFEFKMFVMNSYRAFRPEDKVKHSNDPSRVPLKFDGGSFEPIKFFIGSESEVQPHTISFCYVLMVHS